MLTSIHVIEHSVEPHSKAAPFGSIRSGHIKIEALTEEINVDDGGFCRTSGLEDSVKCSVWLDSEDAQSALTLSQFNFSEFSNTPIAPAGVYTCAIVATFPLNRDQPDVELATFGLILQETSRGSYSRIGCFTGSHGSFDWVSNHFTQRIITIV
jgi:hypothetical protein